MRLRCAVNLAIPIFCLCPFLRHLSPVVVRGLATINLENADSGLTRRRRESPEGPAKEV